MARMNTKDATPARGRLSRYLSAQRRNPTAGGVAVAIVLLPILLPVAAMKKLSPKQAKPAPRAKTKPQEPTVSHGQIIAQTALKEIAGLKGQPGPTRALRIVEAAHSKGAKFNKGDYFKLITAALTAGRFEVAQTFLEIGVSKGIAPESAARLRFEIARARGDFEEALAIFDDEPALASKISVQTIGRQMFELGVPFHEMGAKLTASYGEDAAKEFMARYERDRTRAGMLEAATTAPSDFTTRRKENRFRPTSRKPMERYLSNRTYDNFTRYVTTAFKGADAALVEKLERHACERFPNSIIAAKLRICAAQFEGRTPAPLDRAKIKNAVRWHDAVSDDKHPVRSGALAFNHQRVIGLTFYKDDVDLFGPYLRHHHSLGIRHFLIVDNKSETPPEVPADLRDVVDVRVVSCDDSYFGSRYGVSWLNAIVQELPADWCFYSDIDEFLVLPGGENGAEIISTLKQLDAAGAEACSADMVDVFDSKYLRGASPSNELTDHNLFLAQRLYYHSIDAPFWFGSGGVRRYTHLTKTPLIRLDAGLQFTSNHKTTPAHMAPFRAALLHYKVFSNRNLIGLDAEGVRAHGSIADRSDACVARHIQFALHNDLRPDDLPFVCPADQRTFDRIGVFSNVLDAAALDSHSSSSAKPTLPHADRNLAQIIAALLAIRGRSERQAMRQIFAEFRHRMSMPWVGTGLMLIAALSLADRALAKRVSRVFKAQLARHQSPEELELSAKIISAVAEVDRQIALQLTRDLASLSSSHRANLMSLLVKLGHWEELSNDLSWAGLPDNLRMNAALRTARVHRNWDHCYDILDAELASDAPLNGNLLTTVNALPVPEARDAYRARLLARSLEGGDDRPTFAIRTAFALLSKSDDTDAFVWHWQRYRHRLSAQARRYFQRVYEHRCHGRTWDTVLCVGLSKTGTTSLTEYARQHGMLCAHWTNPFAGALIDESDLTLFDLVTDIPVTYFVRRNPKLRERKLISTERDYASWERSFLNHHVFSNALPAPDYDQLRSLIEYGGNSNYDPQYSEIYREIYFKLPTLKENFDDHMAWVDELERHAGQNMLRIRLGEDNVGPRVAEFLGFEAHADDYPHSNRSRLKAKTDA